MSQVDFFSMKTLHLKKCQHIIAMVFIQNYQSLVLVEWNLIMERIILLNNYGENHTFKHV